MSESGGASPASGAGPGAGPGPGRAHHPRSFKLRFAAHREPGRSYVSAVRPLGLPATVTGKFYSRAAEGASGAAEEARRRTIAHMFARGPRDLPAPRTSAHEYGWWAAAGAAREDPRMRHHLRDSPWMKERLRVLAAPPAR